jgi:hypothetical protein
LHAELTLLALARPISIRLYRDKIFLFALASSQGSFHFARAASYKFEPVIFDIRPLSSGLVDQAHELVQLRVPSRSGRQPFPKATLIYRRTGNLRAVQLLLGHTKIESTARYLGIEVDDALEMAEQVDV